MITFAQNMDLRTALYRIGSYLKHRMTARHTGGHGVHSPYLFEWVRMVMSDENSYYAWEAIEKRRERMLADERIVEFVDYGSGGEGNHFAEDRGAVEDRRVKDIAKGSLAKKKYAQLLARLVNWLGNGRLDMGDRRLVIVELGTSLGITTAYMAMMDSRNKVVTYEGCPAVADIAKENWKALGIKNIDCRVGEIKMEDLDRDIQTWDLAFVDANHTYASTRAYFNVLAEKAHAKSVMIVDDIHYNTEMEMAWRAICADERVMSTMDLYQMGLVFFDQNYWKRHYVMKT